MQSGTHHRLAALLALALLAAAAPACAAGVEGSFQRSLTVSGPAELDVKTGSGSIQLRSGEPGRMEIRGTIRAQRQWLPIGLGAEEKVRRLEQNPPIEQNGNRVRIGNVQDRELLRNVSISYELVVPAETRLRSHTGSGSITVSNISSEIAVSTGSGSIRLDAVKGSVRAATGSGEIHGSGIAGAVVAVTGSGSIRLQQTGSGSVEATTGSGNVAVAGARAALRLESGSGSLTAEGEPAGPWNIETGSGNVTVRLPTQPAFDLYARSGSGQVSVDHPLTPQGKVSRKEVRGKVRGGGVLLDLSTGSGNIQVQ